MIDRDRLAALRAEEEAAFVATHPRSAALAAEADASLLAGVPMPWMTRWAGRFPLFVDEARGAALTDADRAPWLSRIRSLIRELQHEGRSAVIACSALKQSYRDYLAEGASDVRFVHLTGDFSLIEQRLRARVGHFMRPELLASQFATLEEPDDALHVDVSRTPGEIVAEIERGLLTAGNWELGTGN